MTIAMITDETGDSARLTVVRAMPVTTMIAETAPVTQRPKGTASMTRRAVDGSPWVWPLMAAVSQAVTRGLGKPSGRHTNWYVARPGAAMERTVSGRPLVPHRDR